MGRLFKSIQHILTVWIILASSCINLLFCKAATSNGDRKVYIVYLGALPKHQYSPASHHLSLIREVLDDKSNEGEEVLVRSYTRSFNGFAAKLTDAEAQILSSRNDVVSVFPSTNLQLQTTRSWDFLGLRQPTVPTPTGALKGGSDVVIGFIDSGIWPELPSFDDRGFGPPPPKWKGVCNRKGNFTCNNKIVGARYYSAPLSARDADAGHGTHVASTAAGNVVKDANFFGLAGGFARGGFPSARIAVYAVCDSYVCPTQDILAAFDDAIADGVDIISISIGYNTPAGLKGDTIQIGGFHAANKGILTVHAAGNDGPNSGLTRSVAPWLLSVAASTIDRKFEPKVVLGNGKILVGSSVNRFIDGGNEFPMIDGVGASSNRCDKKSASNCKDGCINPKKVKGKVLVCTSADGQWTALDLGAKGVIILDDILNSGYVFPLPGAQMDKKSFDVVTAYLHSTPNPVAKILKSGTVLDHGAPEVAFFSSRGPNYAIPGILKPDVSAPGVEILAAWPPGVSLNQDIKDSLRRPTFNIETGTSMAAPHVAAIAAYIKSLYPNWSPSAIQSAIMTTATPMRPGLGYASAEFAYGSGQLNPVNATNPGLVYEASPADYIKLLCNLGYNKGDVRAITGNNIAACNGKPDPTTTNGFNYPSITAAIQPKSVASFSIGFTRTVTNVGSARSNYRAQIVGGKGLKIEVVPKILTFASLNQKMSFNVTVSGGNVPLKGFFGSAALIWSDGTHSVRSPIVIYT